MANQLTILIHYCTIRTGDKMSKLIKAQINRLQKNIQLIRRLMGWSASELGDKIGVTKQTISNLERFNSVMTKTQYIAMRTVLDYEINKREDRIYVMRIITFLLDYNDFLHFDQRKIVRTLACISEAIYKDTDSKTIAAIMNNTLGESCVHIDIAVAQEFTNRASSLWLEKIIE